MNNPRPKFIDTQDENNPTRINIPVSPFSQMSKRVKSKPERTTTAVTPSTYAPSPTSVVVKRASVFKLLALFVVSCAMLNGVLMFGYHKYSHLFQLSHPHNTVEIVHKVQVNHVSSSSTKVATHGQKPAAASSLVQSSPQQATPVSEEVAQASPTKTRKASQTERANGDANANKQPSDVGVQMVDGIPLDGVVDTLGNNLVPFQTSDDDGSDSPEAHALLMKSLESWIVEKYNTRNGFQVASDMGANSVDLMVDGAMVAASTSGVVDIPHQSKQSTTTTSSQQGSSTESHSRVDKNPNEFEAHDITTGKPVVTTAVEKANKLFDEKAPTSSKVFHVSPKRLVDVPPVDPSGKPPQYAIGVHMDVKTIVNVDFLRELRARWSGKICVALYINPTEGVISPDDPRLESKGRFRVFKYYMPAPDYDGRPSYPINQLRQLLVDNCQSDYLLSLDAGLLPSINLASMLREFTPLIVARKQTTVFVVPSFEMCSERCKKPELPIPASKKELRKCFALGCCCPFKYRNPKAYSATEHGFWLRFDKPLRLSRAMFEKYFETYEPFVVGNPKCFPKFSYEFPYGYRNKATWHMNLRAFGAEYVILPDAFLMHSEEEGKRHTAPQNQNETWRIKKDAMFERLQDFRKMLLISEPSENCYRNFR